MVPLEEVRIGVRRIDRLRSIIGDEAFKEGMAAARLMQDLLSARVVWNVNSTAVGGGVAEMLPSLLGYTRTLGIDTRWLVIEGNDAFFRVTKRLHHALHGELGDGSELGDEARRVYEETLLPSARELRSLVRPRDFVLLHDPQTAGLAPHLADAGVHLIWRSHVGSDSMNEENERAWAFLEPYLHYVPHHVFSRPAYIPPMCDHGKSTIITPSIDPLSTKNRELAPEAVRTILVHTGLIEGPAPHDGDHSFLRSDGTPGRVARRADVVRRGRPPNSEAPMIVQVSRWDPLKDMQGVMEGFALLDKYYSGFPQPQLVLAGPNVSSVADDPEGALVYDSVIEAWRELPAEVRDRVHLACLPTADVHENAAIVNALQRHATIVVQKSLREGFGLTVTEAMWKGRPVVASTVGGIQDQIESGVSGVLLKDPCDLEEFASVLGELLSDPERAERIGKQAKERVRAHFLGVAHLVKYTELLARIDDEAGPVESD